MSPTNSKHATDRPVLVVVTGPTASGKTTLAIRLAEALGCDIISADSRQIYRGMPVTTAAPTPQQLARVRHHLVAMLEPEEPYSAARFEADALALLPQLWERSPYAVVCGGAMLYVDALLSGIDDLPDISPEVRAHVLARYHAEGLTAMTAWLRSLDPAGAADVDPDNPRRVLHAIEICLQSGKPASELRTGRRKERPWRTVMLAVGHTREELFRRINARVDAMVADGLEEEARHFYPRRHLNALNTVGFKEMFAYFDGRLTRDEAIARIAKNTRVYAKKQMLWMRKHPEITIIPPAEAREAAAETLISRYVCH